MATKADDFALFVAVLAEADRLHPGPRGLLPPQELTGRAVAFRKLARSLERYAVKGCNVGLNEREDARASKAADAARDMARLIGATAIVGGDPRGYCLKLVLPTGRYNTWGGAEEGWGVPT